MRDDPRVKRAICKRVRDLRPAGEPLLASTATLGTTPNVFPSERDDEIDGTPAPRLRVNRSREKLLMSSQPRPQGTACRVFCGFLRVRRAGPQPAPRSMHGVLRLLTCVFSAFLGGAAVSAIAL